MRALTVQGSYTGSLGELQELMALARKGSIADFPVHTHGMSEVNEILTRLRSGDIVGRSVIVPEAGANA